MASSLPPASPASPGQTASPVPAYLAQARAWNPSSLSDIKAASLKAVLPRLLSHPAIAAKNRGSGQHNPPVSPGPGMEPGSDAGAVRSRPGKTDRLVALATGGNGRFCHLNPRRGAQIALVECLRRLACSGAVPLAIASRLAVTDPVKPGDSFPIGECLGGLQEAAAYFGLPDLGQGISLTAPTVVGAGDPVLTVTVVGQIEHEKHRTRRWAHAAGEKLVFLGATPTELGGSQYLGIIHQLNTGEAPECDFAAAQKLHVALLALIEAGQVRGAHAVAEGGLLCCVAEMLFAPGQTFGASLDFAALQGTRLDALLFGESQNRAVVIVPTERLGSVLADAHLRGVSAAVIGEVSAQPDLTVRGATDDPVSWPVAELRRGWENSLKDNFGLPGLLA